MRFAFAAVNKVTRRTWYGIKTWDKKD